jgi:hypothetical protein
MKRARGYDPLYRSAENTALLSRIVQRARSGGVAVFDLDGCLFDTRPRQVRIFREYASQKQALALYQVQEEHFKDWSLPTTLRNAGLGEAFIEAHGTALREWWSKRFFTSTYTRYDHAMPGAVELVQEVQAAGAAVVYLTGRDETMKEGTEDSLRAWGFPLGAGEATLLVKPDDRIEDTVFKEQAMEVIAQLGKVQIYLDNEPANVNLFHHRHKDALVVFVETDHSPRPIEPIAAIPWLRSFMRE